MGAELENVERLAPIDGRRKHQRLDRCLTQAQRAQHLDARHRRHREVEEQQVGRVRADHAQRGFTVAALADNLELGDSDEDVAHADADDGMVVGHDYTERVDWLWRAHRRSTASCADTVSRSDSSWRSMPS